MTLDAALLEKLANWRPDNGRQTLTEHDPASGWTAAVTAECADLVGCRLWEVHLTRSTPLAGADLRARAEAVAGRVTGLLEPLRLVEVDAERQVALLRSGPPTARGDDLFYYEVLLQGGGAASVRRYQGSCETLSRRQQISFTLTHEVLAKLVADLTEPA
jgi:hypothetical protein